MKEPKYDRLAEDIKTKIIRQEWKAGDKIPSENMLTEQFILVRKDRE